MKKLMFALLALGLFAGSCQMTEVRNDIIGTENIFAAEIENFGGQTKTSMTPELDVVWSEGDQLTIFRGNYLGDRYQIADQYAGKPYGEFQLIAEEAEDDSFSSGTELPANVAIYPYKEGLTLSKNVDGGNVSYTIEGVEFPSEQEYSENSFGEESFIMTAVTESLSDHKLKFKNVGGALKLQLKGTGTIKTVSIQGNNGESLSGTADVTVSTASTPVYEFTSVSKEVTLDCGTNGVSLKSSVATNFIISLPAVNFTKGFTVTITDINGNTEELKTTAANNIARSAIHKMPEKIVVFENEDSGVPQMYIGYVQRGSYSSFADLTVDDITSSEGMHKMDAQEVTDDYTGFGDVPAKSFLVIAIPKSSGLKATKWNVIEKDCPFSVNPLSNGDVSITIDGNTYQLYGEYTKYALIKDSEEIYYKIKKDPSQPQTLPMYIGYIPDPELKISSYNDITVDMIKTGVANGEIIETDTQVVTADYTSFGNVPEESFLLIALPQSSGLTATKWNIIEQDCPFSVKPISNGETSLTIGGESYQLYGQLTPYTLVVGNNEIYYKIK